MTRVIQAMTASTPQEDFGISYAKEQLRRSGHPLRRIIKRAYLSQVLSRAMGPTVDFGCGAGQMLRLLPLGSVGLEVNPHLIAVLQRQALEVYQAHGDERDFELAQLPQGRFQTLVISHVLEHLPDAVKSLHSLLASCQRLGISRVIVVVPGLKGFASDLTHRTFIDQSWMSTHFQQASSGFRCSSARYYPFPWRSVGDWFVFHETHFVFDRG